MNDLVTTFQNRFGDWAEALLQHLQISLLSLLIAILISVPLAVWLFNKKKASEAILQITGIFQTIPSLALLGLLIPVMGIGTVPAVTALVVYALFPIVQNTITGLQGIDPNLVEAGTAFGMTRWERLRKYELPLAMPVIVSGVRTSAVMIIGTATLAALIGAGGADPYRRHIICTACHPFQPGDPLAGEALAEADPRSIPRAHRRAGRFLCPEFRFGSAETGYCCYCGQARS